uniref:SusC/RagA family TonB-linked outer membrane protein n=1 Tax=Roseihalotalea indica TaxID=2867963 RepID=A0AA49JJU5_9BACT|nr:SusC/RagA family TonB-linked outer membrane protein [Tunicatimonas sp. TK19036]
MLHNYLKRSRLLIAVALLMGGPLLAQQRNVSGIVNSSEDQEGLPGVNVLIVGTTQGTVTDLDGNYSLTVPEGSVTLSFSSVGFQTQTVEVGNQSAINVILEPNVASLDEVMVTALGIEREKKTIGYTVQDVDGEEVALASEPNVLNAISGKIAGVQISQPNGVGMGSSRVVIRGMNNINGDNQPLLIVDGVQIENSVSGAGAGAWTGQGSGTDWGSGINDINPQDIADITVLKGPTAAALYGARGANGVILITTKKGRKSEGLGLTYNNNTIWTTPLRFRKVQNVFGGGSVGADRSIPVNEDGIPVLPTVSFWGSGASWGPRMDGTEVLWWDGEMRPYSPQPDNIKDFFRTAYSSSHNIAFSGANENGSLRVSLTRMDGNTVVPNSEYDRTTVNLNGSLDISSRVRADVSVSYFDTYKKNAPNLGDSESSIGKNLSYNWSREEKLDVLKDFRNPDGSKKTFPEAFGRGRAGNFFWNIYEQNNYRDEDRMIGSLALHYDITSWLKVMGRLGIDNRNDDYEFRGTPEDAEGIVLGRYNHTLGRNRIQNHEVMVTFNKEVATDWNVTANLGGMHWSRDYYSIKGEKGHWDNFRFPNLYTFNNSTQTQPTWPTEDFYDKEINSIFGSVDFAYRDFAFLQITGRNDWSSTLPPESNSYFYPSVSGSFVFTDAFEIESSLLSMGKLRASWAKAATDTDPYQIQPTYGTGSFGGGATGSLRAEIPPLNLKPQTTDSYEVGLELGLLGNRINADIAYYHINSFEQILTSPLPKSSGFNSLIINTGELENYGVELVLQATPIQTAEFIWDVTFNYAHNRNYVVSLSEGAESINIGGIWGGNGPAQEVRPGDEFGTIVGWDYVRYQATDANGNPIDHPSNGKPIIDENGEWYLTTDQRVPVGNATPRWIGGLTNTFTYKGFSLNTLIDMKIGGDTYFGTYVTGMTFGQSLATLEGREPEFGGLEWVDAEGNVRQDGIIKEGVYEDGEVNDKVVNHRYKYSDYGGWGAGALTTPGVHENTWVRLRQLSLSYTFPQSMLSRIGFVQQASISLVGRNLWYLYDTAPENINPEGINGVGNAQGFEWGSLPVQASYGFNVKVSF